MDPAPDFRNGFAWTQVERCLPRVLTAMHGRGPQPAKAHGRLINSHWVLDYSCSHCGRVRVGAADAPWLERPAGIAHLYPPGVPYWEDMHGPDGRVESAFMVFDGGEEAGLAACLAPGERFVRLADPDRELHASLVAAARAGTEHGEAGFWEAQAALCRLISTLKRLQGVAGKPAPSSTFVAAVDALLAAGVGGGVSLAGLARALSVSPSTLSHRYAREAGRPPLVAFHDLRMQAARALVLRGLKLEAVAAETGFCDASHLSKAFRRHFGTPPSACRRPGG